MLVLHGSDPSAGFTTEYARLLATHGYAALRVQYVDVPTGPETLREVPLEGFDAALEWLVQHDDVQRENVGVVGWSRGSEAAFLTADRNDCVGAVVGYVPSAYAFPAWPNPNETSAWSVDGEACEASRASEGRIARDASRPSDRASGPEAREQTGNEVNREPVPYVPPNGGAANDAPNNGSGTEGEKPSVVRFRRTLERTDPAVLERAALPVEDIDGPVLLISGSDDRVWPSSQFSETLCERLDEVDREWPHTHCEYEDAGHAITVPYESTPEPVLEELGGTNAGTAAAAADAWERTLSILRRGVLERNE